MSEYATPPVSVAEGSTSSSPVDAHFVVYSLTESGGKDRAVCSSASGSLVAAVEDKVASLLDKKLQLVKDRSFTETISSEGQEYLSIFCYVTNFSENQALQQFLVCLVIENSEDIENSIQLMLPDINNYVVDIVAPILFSQDQTETTTETENALQQWYSASIDYIGRCITTLGSYLPNFLHAALLGYTVVSPQNPVLETNLRRVARMIQLVEEDETKQIQVLYEDDKAVMDYESKNLFCEDWAQALQETAEDPISCRQKIDQYRLLIVKRLNDLRRMLDNARMHNHDLYRSYSMIERSNNEDVLLAVLTNDIKNNQSLAEVIGTIVDFSVMRRKAEEIQ
uniref:Uncharacterized protein n=1 Tax=Vannella robusta TaxID=1487602 RepID=A0A7S4MRB6_9EUKA|mmetsp:Transcript_7753/g.9601  ORF Transcript_7753/g.9601 Transcript_7753/m.9601 type:complete len:339 (+) Transcript_7753:12-1028(+)